MVAEGLLEPRLNQYVDRYVTTDAPLHDILVSAPVPRSPLVQSLLYIEECLAGRRLAKNAIDAAEQVPLKGNDPELLVLMLSRWAELSCRIGRPTEAEALVNRAASLIADGTHPVIRAVATFVESVLADTTGNKARREALLGEIIASLPAHSPRRKFYVIELAMALAQQGRGVEARDALRELAWQCNERLDIANVQLVEFVDAVETGRAREALRLMPRIEGAAQLRLRRDTLPAFVRYREILRVLQDAGAASVPGPGPDPAESTGAQVVRHLARGRAEEALRLARLDAGKVMGSIFGAGFYSFNLVRAELATGAPEGARRLLNMRRGRGNRHYLDDLFFARAEWLAGNRRAAAAHFAEVLDAVERYRARERLDFELRLARELSHSDVIDLVRSAERVRRRAARPRPAYAAPPPAPAAAPEAAAEPRRRIDVVLGRSPAMREIRETITRFADLDAPLLITGETGTGKDLVARALHESSSRREHPFIPVNCASITETLLESELFGHERGAFTGAEKANKGLFEEAGRGTILLDEIGDISPRLQQTLLRVLETGEIRAVGSARSRRIDCRILAATNADLAALAAEGRFRRDLLFRLQRLVVHIPALRERPEDILLLARHFLDAGRSPGAHAVMNAELERLIRGYDWPGNVRELRNVIERMRLMHSDKLSYTDADLDLKFRVARAPGGEAPAPRAPEPAAAAPDVRAAEARPPAPPLERLRPGRSRIRRIDRLRELFAAHRKLTRGEVVQALGVCPNTATKDLKDLCDAGFIERVTPSASTRSHYFTLKEAVAEPPPGDGVRLRTGTG
ncbi:MAG: AAA family ATPase [Lentisphaerae bacterium]|nr:AAA family ATPase [Lentisphaerota bacterium]